MVVTFQNCTVLSKFVGKSKAGNDYGRIKFLTAEYDVFEIFVGASDIDALQRVEVKHMYDLDFLISPAYNGGVRLSPAW